MDGFKLIKVFNVVDIIIVSYLLDTLILSFFIHEPGDWVHPVLFRILTFVAIGFIIYHDNTSPSKASKWIRYFYPILLISYIYGETAELSHIFFRESLDGYLMHLDEAVFGLQPSLIFNKIMPQNWFRELMNMGYFSYYFFIFGIPLAAFYRRKKDALKIMFVLIFSFLSYYIFFIVFPTEGPQFYILHGELSAPQGLFGHLVYYAHIIGEQPTGAFPSSHVGIMLIFCWITYKYLRKAFLITLIFTILITFATVYIKAHYAIDVLGGYISAPILIFLSLKFYKLSSKVLEE